ncbi:coenzyme PQQ synthesis protein D (PqqD) [Ectopseudomonas oleovorans]|uniref:Coenzyme PQQ synthesis protein D (PqqD) n=1 Tax=Ectopseudomonas oleovorans TaxID=301 RepID=A0A397NN17_ECTOL|nr:PqqD family protein [Pseudomonas oleovorans]RIA34841.1 coenzyme PQQ synthesis protein D (PqqD) [Pseudomonas oleovorans]
MSTILGQSTVARNPSVLSAEVSGELVLMSVSCWHYFGLNSVASDIWKRLSSPVRVDELCQALASEYEAETDVIRQDVLELLNKLASRELIEVQV